MIRRLLFSLYYAILVAFLRLGRMLWGRECMVGLVADARGDAGCYREHQETPIPWSQRNAHTRRMSELRGRGGAVMRSYTRYWFALKSGELRTQEKRPSGRLSVAVITTRDERDEYHTTHRIVGSFTEATLEAWCGYDRGPRLEGMIRTMLGGAR